jgi:hypothetical protein
MDRSLLVAAWQQDVRNRRRLRNQVDHADVRNINFGALLTGDGSAWFDGLTVELDGKPYAGDGLIDLDFEESAKGFC